MKKLIFFPWTTITPSERDKATSFTDTGDFEVALYTGTTVKKVKSCIGGQIYVFGHCSSGSDTLSNDANNHLTYREVADRLEASGLRKIFAGALKIYACESGAHPQTALSFAKKFAKYFYFDKKYLLTRVYGYERPLNSLMTKTPLNKVGGLLIKGTDREKAHKWAASGYYASSADVDVIKAKESRSYFSPF